MQRQRTLACNLLTNMCHVLYLLEYFGIKKLFVWCNCVGKLLRQCPFCDRSVRRLTRHLRSMHKDDQAVSEAMSKSGKAQQHHFRQLKRQGIKKYNELQVALKRPIARERRGKDNEVPVVCGACGTVLSRAYFWRHRRECLTRQTNAIPAPVPVHLSVNNTAESRLQSHFRREVLTRLWNDAVGRLCMENDKISMIGKWQDLHDWSETVPEGPGST